jgi:hypothetical protein
MRVLTGLSHLRNGALTLAFIIAQGELDMLYDWVSKRLRGEVTTNGRFLVSILGCMLCISIFLCSDQEMRFVRYLMSLQMDELRRVTMSILLVKQLTTHCCFKRIFIFFSESNDMIPSYCQL